MHSHSLLEKSSLLRAGQTVGSVVSLSSLDLAGSTSVTALCEIVEFRADALSAHLSAVQDAMKSCPVPTLLTVRSQNEAGGGGGLGSDSARLEVFETLMTQANLVDIEIASLHSFPELIPEVHRRGLVLVASFHDFAGTPDTAQLTHLMEMARDAGADIVKFATTLRDTQDLSRLAALQEKASQPLSTMGMGPLGRVSRLLLAELGSVLNYGYLDQPTVPGQWPAARLRSLIQEVRGVASSLPTHPI